MAKIYKNNKTNMLVVSGTVSAISDDRKSISVKSESYNRDEKKAEPVEMTFETSLEIGDDVAVGKNVTIMGYEQIDVMSESSKWIGAYVSAGNSSFQYKTLAVVNGDVVYARYNDELDENGNPNMTRERMGADSQVIPPKAKSPHFDIGVSAVDAEGKRVLHTVKAYPDPVKDKDGKIVEGKKNFDKIEALKKRFANFDKETNPMRVTIATQPGQISTSVREYNGTEYENIYSNHMGIYSLDIEYLKERTREQAPAEKAEEKKADEKVEETSTQEVAETTAPTNPPAQTSEAEEFDESLFTMG